MIHKEKTSSDLEKTSQLNRFCIIFHLRQSINVLSRQLVLSAEHNRVDKF